MEKSVTGTTESAHERFLSGEERHPPGLTVHSKSVKIYGAVSTVGKYMGTSRCGLIYPPLRVPSGELVLSVPTTLRHGGVFSGPHFEGEQLSLGPVTISYR